MSADEEELLEEPAEEEVREVHPESPELVGAVDEDEEPEAVEEEPEAEPVVDQEPQHYAALQNQVHGLTSALTAERRDRQAAEEQVKELAEWVASQKAEKEAAAAAAEIPEYEKDPLGHLAARTTAAVTGKISPEVAAMAAKVEALERIVTERHQRDEQARAEQGWEQTFSMQERAASPEQRQAIEEYHVARYQEGKRRGLDDQSAQEYAQKARFQLYMTGVRSGQNHGPSALLTLRQLAGVPMGAPVVPQQPGQASVTPPRAPASETSRPRLVREPPPQRGRRNAGGADKLAWLVANFTAVPENELADHIGKIAKERDISENRAYDLVHKALSGQQVA